ncbi:MAG: hypothetical protein R2873_28295 [Caldilineaceae bacterium]
MVDGGWQYDGNPVELLFLIRTEDERQEIGDYVATLFEDMGFTVTCDYRTSAEASPIWAGSDPAEGQWYVYTRLDHDRDLPRSVQQLRFLLHQPA